VVADKEGNKEIKKRICYKEGRGDKGEKRTWKEERENSKK
jgi:hypothetical protein